MYTFGVYAVCAGLVFVSGAVLFAGFAAVLVVNDGCLKLAALVVNAFSRLGLGTGRGRFAKLLDHIQAPHRMEWNDVIVNHGVHRRIR
jgi:hypothetical protein